MPIFRLAKNAAFDPETTRLLVSAFNEAWESVVRSGSDFATNGQATSARLILARRIIDTAARGERDHLALVTDAVAFLAELNTARAVGAE